TLAAPRWSRGGPPCSVMRIGAEARSRRSPRSGPVTSPPATWRAGNGADVGMRIDRTWIPMRDGIRLAATLYIPQGEPAREGWAPILEYLPYRKDDAMFDRDFDVYSYVVPRGYVGARVDIRGTGASEGVLPGG